MPVTQPFDGFRVAITNRSNTKDQVRFNQLCESCMTIFSTACEQQVKSFAFHRLPDLIASAHRSCHFCHLLVREVHLLFKKVFEQAEDDREDQDDNNNPPSSSPCSNRDDPKDQNEPGPDNDEHIDDTYFDRCEVRTRIEDDLGITFSLFLGSDHLAIVDLHWEDRLDMRTASFRQLKCASTAGEEAWSQVAQWFSDCEESHHICKETAAKERSNAQLPRRLLEVGNGRIRRVRIIETSELDQDTAQGLSYLTLSHRWGNKVPLTLNSSTNSELRSGIKLEKLPLTFRNAVEITRRLKISYLWIDSLCIIQDSIEDWNAESVRMHQIYKHSFLNIAAAAAFDASEGLFSSRSTLAVAPVRVKIGTGSDARYAVTAYEPNLEGENDRDSLFTRGWVFQEWLLAPRTLIFGRDELHWECQSLTASETFPDGRRINEYDDIITSIKNDWQSASLIEPRERFQLWCRIVSEYSGKRLTKNSDKLVAVSGVSAQLGDFWRAENYLNGLWSYKLRQGLLWRSSIVSSTRRPSAHVCTWSWASIDGSVELYSHEFSEGLAEVLKSQVRLLDPTSPYGSVAEGYVQIRGPMIAVVLFKSTSAGSSKGCYQIHFPVTHECLHELKSGSTGNESNESKIPANRKRSTKNVRVARNAADASRRTLKTKRRRRVSHPPAMTLDAHWDETRMYPTAKALKVFLALFEISAGSGASAGLLRLEGLILLPTSEKKGEFERLGQFRILESLGHHTESGYNHRLYQETTARQSALSLRAILHVEERARRSIYSEQNITEDDAKLRKLKDRMLAYESKNLMGCTTNGTQDPYCNGFVDHTLLHRFRNILAASEYPRINAFLQAVYVQNRRNRSNLDDGLFEIIHGDGYFTYRII